MSKIEYHYQTVGRILVHLVNNGLSRVDLEESDAMDIMTERWGDEEEVLAAFEDCLHWMIGEGLIRVRRIESYDGGYSFMGIQLTSTGIEIIRVDPNDSDIGASILSRVEEANSEPMDTSIYTKIGEFVGGALGGFSKSLGAGG